MNPAQHIENFVICKSYPESYSVREVIGSGFFYASVFVIAFSLIVLQQPIGKKPKSEFTPGAVNEYFKQERVKKRGGYVLATTTPDLEGLNKSNS